MSERLKHFAIRVVAMSAIAIAFYFTIGLGSLAQTFLIGLAASAGSQLVYLVVRKLEGTQISNLTLGVFGLVAIAATVFVVYIAKGPDDLGVRYRTVDELMAFPGKLAGKPVKLHGYLAKGTRTTDGFVLEEKGAQLRVVYTGPPPEWLRDGGEVVATGRLRRDGPMSSEFHFLAHEVIAKCPANYKVPTTGERPDASFR